MQSKASTVEQYLAQLPEDRRSAIEAVRRVILAHLDGGYEEGMQYGMIGYYVPHRVFPAGYHCDPRQPLPFAALAAQKQYMSLYLMGIYGGNAEDGTDASWFAEAWRRTGKKLDMGKSCVRFKRIEDVALEVVAEAIRRQPAQAYIARYQATRATTAASSAPGRAPESAPGKASGIVSKTRKS